MQSILFNTRRCKQATTRLLHAADIGPKKWDHDVMICGGGVVGAALAADLLHRTGGLCNVGLVESTPPKDYFKTDADAPDVRVYALSPHSIEVLERIGAWKYIEPRSKPYNTMQIWEESGPGMLRFCAKEMDATELGRICEDQTIQSAIFQSIKDKGYNFTTYFNHAVNDVKLPMNGNNPNGAGVVSLQVKGSKEEVHLHSRFVISTSANFVQNIL